MLNIHKNMRFNLLIYWRFGEFLNQFSFSPETLIRTKGKGTGQKGNVCTNQGIKIISFRNSVVFSKNDDLAGGRERIEN